MGATFLRRFKWSDSSDMGPGFVPDWIENADPVANFGAAHDALEHFPRCIGGFEGELMAFGAMHYVRGEAAGYDWNRGTIYAAQKSDLEFFLPNVLQGDQTLKDPGTVNLRALDNDPGFNLDELRRNVRGAIASVCREQDYNDDDSGGSASAATRRKLPHQADDRMVRWIVKGYLKAKRRFERMGVSPWEAHCLFKEVTRKFSALCEGGEHGEEIHVRIDFRKQTVRVDRLEQWMVSIPRHRLQDLGYV